MKRRRFFQYTSIGGAGFLLAASNSVLASTLPGTRDTPTLGFKTFAFDVDTVNRAGKVQQQQTHTAQYFSEALTHFNHLEMVAISSGKFWMGAPGSESQAKGEELPRHSVKLSSFFLSKYPITQSQWAAAAVLPKVNRDLSLAPSHFQGGDRPVESVSWLDAVEFCDRISQHTGRDYQLPSEAQWEYACRAGTKTAFSTGETITSQLADYRASATYKAEVSGDYRRTTMPVGSFSPNAFGLHDMHGNVWEWCADGWHRNYRGAPRDGRSRRMALGQQSSLRTIRGGGWLDAPEKIRSASRSGYGETALNRTIGFRVMTT